MLCTNVLLSLIKNDKNSLKCQKRCLGFFGCRCNQINLILVLSLQYTLKLRQLVKLFSLNSNEFALFFNFPHEVKSDKNHLVQTFRLLNSKLSCKPHANTMLSVVHLTYVGRFPYPLLRWTTCTKILLYYVSDCRHSSHRRLQCKKI